VNVTVRFLCFFAEKLEEVDVAPFRNLTDSQLHKYDNGTKTFRRGAEQSLAVVVRHLHDAQKVTLRYVYDWESVCPCSFLIELNESIR
jgi:hypothetical protein